MASSFRIKLKLGGKPGQEPSTKQSQESPNRNLISPSRSNSVFERGSSAIEGDGSSLLSEDIADEEEEDELEDSPPPPDQQQMNQNAQGKVRKLSGAAAMKAANSLKKSKGTTSSAGGTPTATGSDREASVSTSRRGSQEVSPTPSGSGTYRKRASLTNEQGKTIDEMSMAEIEALPAAKRRKGMKLRGAAGPGRGWRKGLKMDMKPVYRAPGDSPPAQVIPTTPSSFAQKPKSALARDALSKANTPMRSESPNGDSSVGEGSRHWEDISGSVGNTSMADVKPSRVYPASSAAVAARKARAAGLAGSMDARRESGSNANTHASTPNPVSVPTKQSVPTMQEEGKAIRAIIRGGPPVLPPPKIPIGFVVPNTIDKQTTSKFTRKWQRSGREILSLGGRVWSAVSWISEESNKFPTSAEMKANASSTNVNNASSSATHAHGTSTPALTGMKSALATGNVTPAITSRAASPVPSNGTPGDQTGRSSPVASKGNLAPPPPPSAMSRHPSNFGKQNSSPSSSDWRGSSAAFAAANRGRS
ncbi:uncharacterized protein FA14DRAFT_91512 [Meira miltonrushii]|uniref:Uncharacterized protein n=1 Tax=Meira miltonrushii TaxID=1280837 RepID=A0A316V246_9BASI|nr:uncharacterized protein FA14DRAFT_91512 [Meira miltonrushii]PWN31616.1 hypothetical protein FA14DRAFT_91512 [Meira miltonrushii]